MGIVAKPKLSSVLYASCQVLHFSLFLLCRRKFEYVIVFFATERKTGEQRQNENAAKGAAQQQQQQRVGECGMWNVSEQ